MLNSSALAIGQRIAPRSAPRIYDLSFYLFTLLGVGLLNNTNSPLVKPIGLSSMAITCFLALLGLANARKAALIVGIWLPLIIIYTLALTLEISTAAIWTYGQLIASIAVFAWASQVHNNPQLVVGLSRLAKIILFFAVVSTAFCVGHAGETFTNPNTAAEATVSFIFVEAFRRSKVAHRSRPFVRLMQWIGGLSLLVLANSRSCWVEIIVFTGVFLGWKTICQSRLLYWGTFATLVLSISGFTHFLAGGDISSESYFDAIQEASWHYTQKNFDTRSGEWTQIVASIQQRPWTGWGLGTKAQTLGGNEEGISAHSQYLEIGMRAGYPGIVAFIVVFCSLWAIYWRGRHRPEIRVAGAILLAVLAQQAFEVNLLQSGLCIGFIWWMLMGLGAGSAISAMHVNRPTRQIILPKARTQAWQRIRQ